MLNLIFWKKVQGLKHPGRRGLVEIPNIKVLFKVDNADDNYNDNNDNENVTMSVMVITAMTMAMENLLYSIRWYDINNAIDTCK